jgi:hypothetical protein
MFIMSVIFDRWDYVTAEPLVPGPRRFEVEIVIADRNTNLWGGSGLASFKIKSWTYVYRYVFRKSATFVKNL